MNVHHSAVQRPTVSKIEMLTDKGEHFDTIRLKTQAPGFAGVMCTGESGSTETQPPKPVSDQMIGLGRLEIKRKTGGGRIACKPKLAGMLRRIPHEENLCKKLWMRIRK